MMLIDKDIKIYIVYEKDITPKFSKMIETKYCFNWFLHGILLILHICFRKRGSTFHDEGRYDSQ